MLLMELPHRMFKIFARFQTSSGLLSRDWSVEKTSGEPSAIESSSPNASDQTTSSSQKWWVSETRRAIYCRRAAMNLEWSWQRAAPECDWNRFRGTKCDARWREWKSQEKLPELELNLLKLCLQQLENNLKGPVSAIFLQKSDQWVSSEILWSVFRRDWFERASATDPQFFLKKGMMEKIDKSIWYLLSTMSRNSTRVRTLFQLSFHSLLLSQHED